MQIGFLTGPFHGQDLESVVHFAAGAGFQCLEIATGPGSRHLDPLKLDDSRATAIRKSFDSAGLQISSLANYMNILHPDPAEQERLSGVLRSTIDAAHKLGVDIVCTMAGMPLPGKSRMQTIEEAVPGAFTPLCEYAAKLGIKLALENWFETNIQNLEHWERIFALVPNDNFGLNFDPSHLVHQGIDYMAAVERFGPRIFHTHAKDTEINQQRLARVGNRGGGWWRYVIPGLGEIHWGRYVGALRRVGFKGAVSIEHEDSTFSPEEGMKIGLANLKLTVI